MNSNYFTNRTDVLIPDEVADKVHPEAIIVPLICAIIFIFGVISHISLLSYVVCSVKRHIYENLFVASLAIGDLIMLTLAMPFFSTVYTFLGWPYGDFICKISNFAQTLSTAVVIFTLVGLTVERYSIATSFEHSQKQKQKLIGLLSIWFGSTIFSLPDLISANVMTIPGNSICILHPLSWGAAYPVSNSILKFLLLFLIPLIVMVPIHLHMISAGYSDYPVEFTNVSQQGPENQETKDKLLTTEKAAVRRSPQERKRIDVTILLLLGLVITFIVCRLPRHIYFFWFFFDPSNYNMFWHYFKIVSHCGIFVNAGINPVLYYFLDIKFRNFIWSRICRKHTNMNEDTTGPPGTDGDQAMSMTEVNISQ